MMKKRPILIIIGIILLLLTAHLTKLCGVIIIDGQIRFYFNNYNDVKKILQDEIIQDKSANLFAKYDKGDSPEANREAYFNFLVDAIKNAYCALDYKEKNFDYMWEDIVNYYQPLIQTVSTDDEFLYLCSEMIDLFNDGHTVVTYEKTNTVEKSLPLGIKLKDDKYIVYAFHEAFKAKPEYLAQIELGDQLIQIDGRGIKDITDNLKSVTIYGFYPRLEPVFVKRFFRSYFYYIRRFSDTESSDLTFRKDDGSEYTLKIKWSPARAVRSVYGAKTNYPSQVKFESKILEDTNIGYIKIASWTKNSSKFIEAFQSMYETDAVIIDVRNNLGGSFPGFGQTVLAHFIDGDLLKANTIKETGEDEIVTLYKEFRNSELYHLFGRNGLHYQQDQSYEGKFYPKVPVKLRAKELIYDKPVVLLVNQAHFSANDKFIVAFKDLEVGSIIGRLQPIQSFGQPIRIKTPWNNWGCAISVMVPYSPTGDLMEGRLIEPDIFVPMTKEEIIGVSDPILDAALEYLNN